MTESYRRASNIDRDSRFFLDRNESSMAFESEFDGEATIGFIRMPTNSSSFRATPLFEGREDYSGSFRIAERTDEYGRAVSSERSAYGTGIVSVDRRVGSSQRSYEHGAGSYSADEVIETSTNYIAKDISVAASPAGRTWSEGIGSKDPGRSHLGEEYTSITRLDKETVARGLSEMETAASFSGTARYRTIYSNLTENTTLDHPSAFGVAPSIDFDETYTGDYAIERRVLISGAARYDRPHLNVSKTLESLASERAGTGEKVLAGEPPYETIRVATYTIRIENDGNRALGPIHVQDLFPPGAKFLQPSTLRPSSLTEGSANWTLTHLAVGGVAEITLRLDVTSSRQDELVNRVVVCGGYGGGSEWTCASNSSAPEMRWLTCCPEGIFVVKTAEVDPDNPMAVRYTVEIENEADATRTATVTDHLPRGMILLSSSLEYSSIRDGVVVWHLPEIAPRQKATIEFSALAPFPGRFTNVVEVDARSVDGPVVEPVYVASVVQVGTAEECGPTGCGIWQPPAWDFQSRGSDPDLLACDLLTPSAGCTASGCSINPGP